MGARGVHGINDFDTDLAVDDGWGFGLNVGYRTHGFFAANLDFEIMTSGFEVEDVTIGNLGMTLYAKLYPLAFFPAHGNWLDRFQPYVKAGPGFQYFYFKNESVDDTGFVARFGGGLELYLYQQLALTFDATYNLTTGPIDGLDSWSVGFFGLQWRF